MAALTSRHPFNLYYSGGEYVKICGSQDGYFPDFGHHIVNEMGGIWLHPIKLLDGFWLKVTDLDRGIAVWSRADGFTNEPWGTRFDYDHGLGHIPVRIDRMQFAPELEKGMAAHYRLQAYGKGVTRLRLELLARTDLRPVWFSDEIGILDGARDEAQVLTPRRVLVKDSDHEWYAMIGSDLPGEEIAVGPELYGPEFTAGNGCGVAYAAEIELAEREEFEFRLIVAGSYVSREACEQSYQVIEAGHGAMLEEKRRLYEQVQRRAELSVEGEDRFTEMFKWVKWNNQWLVQTVDGVGRGLTAGGPTYPWWFGCDNTYSLQGVLAVGDAQLAKDTLNLILEKSEEANGNGRIVHEVTTMGAVSNPGNTQETAHYITFLWEIFSWTGDEELLRRHYEYAVKGIEWLLGEMDPDGDLFPSGYGIIEIAGLNMELIDSAVYTAQALKAMAKMSGYLGDLERTAKYKELADRASRAVNEVFWMEEEGLFADAVASKRDIAPKVDYMVSLAEQQGLSGYRDYVENLLETADQDEHDQGWLLNKNWVIVTPMEAGIADPQKAERALKTMRSSTFIGEYGTYLAGIYQQGTMTISTGVHAVAEAANGYPDQALELLERMGRSFSRVLPGSFSEMSPDYGCVVQAWTIYAMAVPVVRHFFGIRPAAYEKKLILAPKLPRAWEGRSCELKQVVVGDAEFDIRLKEVDGHLHAVIHNPGGWQVEVQWDGMTKISQGTRIEVIM
ncbi:alpha-L-rhamnosidase-related protein [Paenibacillus tuaregi]|uniref:alpha-L-rhamnosidase-related protein n=1 Tax=Paenibacillus tuaregi TaxID=1816681 RepID=UPI000838CA69|nr:glycogen debranching protein [Paenibacillus tuaregi]